MTAANNPEFDGKHTRAPTSHMTSLLSASPHNRSIVITCLITSLFMKELMKKQHSLCILRSDIKETADAICARNAKIENTGTV